MSSERVTRRAIPGVLDVLASEGEIAPLVLDSPHSGEMAPADFKPAAPKSAWLHAADRYVDQLSERAPSLGVPLLRAQFPRIYLDPNRAPDDIDPNLLSDGWDGPLSPSAKTKLGKGLVWTSVPPNGEPLYANPLDQAAVERRLEICYHPYHECLATMIDQAVAQHGYVLHLNCHSMQSVSHRMHEEGAGIRRPDFILSDRDGATCSPAMTRVAKHHLETSGYQVEVNTLFKGAEIVRRHGRPDEGRHSLQIEINRALYMNEVTLERAAGFETLQQDLTDLIDRLARMRLAAP